MALTFNAINRAAAFNPTQAFPLDKRSYFESKDLAIAAAQTAAEPGTDAASNTVYYIGQTLVVNENNKATLYIIQPDKTLKEVGSVPVGDGQSIVVGEDGKIQLVGFGDATDGAVAQIKVNQDGTRTLVWTTDHEERIINLEGTDDGITGAVKYVEYDEITGVFTFKDSKGNLIKTANLAIEKVVTNFAYHATYLGKDGKTYDNVLVLILADGEEQIVEIEDLFTIYEVEENATEVQIAITPSTEPEDENDPSSDHPHIISATIVNGAVTEDKIANGAVTENKIANSVKEAINKGVKAHDGLSNADSDALLQSEDNIHKVVLKGSIKTDIAKGVEANKAYEGLSSSNSDVQLEYSEDRGDHRVLLKSSVKADIAKGVTAYNALFDGTTTFVLNGGNASGYTVATDESTEV